MHLFCRPKYGVNRAGLNTLGAADAFVFADIGDGFHLLLTVLLVQGNGLYIEQISQRLDGGFTARGALVNGLATGDCCGVGSAPGVATLTALGLGENVVDLFGNRVAFGFETNGSETEHRAKYRAQPHQGDQCRYQREL